MSTKLPNCEKKNKNSKFQLHFRCVICGDSKTDKYKKRGWIYESKGELFYNCFNCGYSTFFTKFLKDYDPELHKEYTVELFKEKMVASPPPVYEHHIEKFDKKRIEKFDLFKSIPKISQLPNDHPAKAYIMDRKIPSNAHFRIYYVDKFAKWVNTVLPDKFGESALKYDEGRIVIPFIDQYGYVFGFQGRSLKPDSKSRYITIMLRDDRPKICGLDVVDPKKTVLLVEGPFDSFFLPNCAAMAGADAQIDKMFSRLNTIIIFDNEPRNPEITSRIHKYIDQGWKVCLWPASIPKTSPDGKSVKDINDMVKELGMTTEEVHAVILSNFYSGLQAKMKMIEWSKA